MGIEPFWHVMYKVYIFVPNFPGQIPETVPETWLESILFPKSYKIKNKENETWVKSELYATIVLF